jgi:hypothetical protein
MKRNFSVLSFSYYYHKINLLVIQRLLYPFLFFKKIIGTVEEERGDVFLSIIKAHVND